MSQERPRNRRTKAIGVATVAAVAAGAASLMTTAVCSCWPVAQAVLHGSIRMETPVLQRFAERRFPVGIGEAEVVRRISGRWSEKFCAPRDDGAVFACTLPYDKNLWRASHVELVFAFDAKRELASVTAKPVERYVWQ